mgnify:FL=1
MAIVYLLHMRAFQQKQAEITTAFQFVSGLMHYMNTLQVKFVFLGFPVT